MGLTVNEIEDFYEAQRDQLNLMVMLELLATTEAILRLDFEARITARKKDSLSRRFRAIRKKRADRVRLDEDILDAMKDEGIPVAGFKGILKLRHWLAHGRHWRPRLGRSYAPSDVFDISKALLESITPF